MKLHRLVAMLFLALAFTACTTGMNYRDPQGPRYSGGMASGRGQPAETLRLVSFNLEYADSVDAAIRLLTSHPDLRDADLVFLQEMDHPGTVRIAEALGVAFVYYPALRRGKTQKDFGNAILSRWPIESDEKLLLPNRGVFTRTRRIATAATIRVGTLPVRVYSTHLATPIGNASIERGEQLAVILDDARLYDRVVIGGDMNDEHIGELAVARGYLWPTRDLPHTTRLFSIPVGTWDHIFLRGFAGSGSAGVVDIPEAVSDHKPIWATAIRR
jgi:endonuclease/exonuclease/phosphatase family metal-dependent hydrolase